MDYQLSTINYQLIIIGAGPAGISAAYEAQKLDLNYLVLEKSLIGNTIYNYPIGLTVFSTVNELEFSRRRFFRRGKSRRAKNCCLITRDLFWKTISISNGKKKFRKLKNRGENHFRRQNRKRRIRMRKRFYSRSARCSIRDI